MRKIFLTSGLVVCMACPAFAETGFTTTEIGQGTAVMDNTQNPPVQTGTEIDDACINAKLNSFSAPVTLTALWTNNIHTIELNDSLATNYGAPATTAVVPTVLYAAHNDKIYQTRQNIGTPQNPDYAYSNAVTGDLTDVIESNPVGKSVTLTFNPNYTQLNGLQTNGTYSSSDASTVVAPTSQFRAFDGFWASATTAASGEQYINDQGVITSAGVTAGTSTDQDQTWYAHYKCAEPTHTATPSLTGYHFDGWYTDNTLTTAMTNWCINENTEVFAKWSANTHKITYSCGTQPGSESQTGQVPAEATGLAYDSTINLASNTCEYKGWSFAGWKCTYNLANGTQVENGQLYAPDALTGIVFHTDTDVVCTATWTANEISLTWKDGTTPEGGNTIDVAGTDSASCDYDSGITLPNAPSRAGYIFNGWTVTNPND